MGITIKSSPFLFVILQNINIKMLTTIKGVYEEGHIILKEEAHVKSGTEVIVTFLSEEKETPKVKKERVPGGLKGRISISDDFNEPLDDLKDYM